MKVGFACGVFDLFHAGHVIMLKECKEQCDYLLVALNRADFLPEDKNKPIYTIDERVVIMSSCKFVDEVITYNSEEELLQILKTRKIDVRFLGEDYKNKPITGADLNIDIYYTNRDHGLSTSSYLRKIVMHQSQKDIRDK